MPSADLNTEVLKTICSGKYRKTFDEYLKKLFVNTCKFYKHDMNRFVSMLQKGVYSWMIGKNSVKHHHLEKNFFTVA